MAEGSTYDKGKTPSGKRKKEIHWFTMTHCLTDSAKNFAKNLVHFVEYNLKMLQLIGDLEFLEDVFVFRKLRFIFYLGLKIA